MAPDPLQPPDVPDVNIPCHSLGFYIINAQQKQITHSKNMSDIGQNPRQAGKTSVIHVIESERLVPTQEGWVEPFKGKNLSDWPQCSNFLKPHRSHRSPQNL